MLIRYAPVDVVTFVALVTFVHVPLTFFWSWIVAPATGEAAVVLRVPLTQKGRLAATVMGAVTVSAVGTLGSLPMA